MKFGAYSSRDLQNIQSMLQSAVDNALSIDQLDVAVGAELVVRLGGMPLSKPSPASRRRVDNLTTCPVCGSPAVIEPLTPADRTPTATHAIQCQNRPATDRPWIDGMCGHTEYIVRGEG